MTCRVRKSRVLGENSDESSLSKSPISIECSPLGWLLPQKGLSSLETSPEKVKLYIFK